MLTIIKKDSEMEKLKNIHPGEILLEEFLIPLNITPYRLSKDLKIPQTRISEILKGNRSITADTDLRLCRFFGLSNGYWLRAQIAYDIEISQFKLRKDLLRIKPWKHSKR